MVFHIGRIVWALVNPLSLAGMLLLASLLFLWRKRPRRGFWCAAASLGTLAFFSSGLAVWLLGMPLESPYLPEKPAEEYPAADAILLLGGSIGRVDSPELAYPDFNSAADRVWHAARLYRAGKAPAVIISGTNDLGSTSLALSHLGVPSSAILVDGKSRNTAENLQYSADLLGGEERFRGRKPRVLLVTSAWHMRRSMLLARREDVDAVPAPCDYLAAPHFISARDDGTWTVVCEALRMNTDNLFNSSILLKEWIGWLQKKLF